MAQNTGTLITAPVRPNDDQDPIASFYADDGFGGLHSYETIAEMGAIIAERRNWGMLVNVWNDGGNTGTYQLQYGYDDTDIMNNANWVTLQFTPGGVPTLEQVLEAGEAGSPTGGSNITADHAITRGLTDEAPQPSLALAGTGGGNVDTGNHHYVATYVSTNGGETVASFPGNITVTNQASNGKVNITINTPLPQTEVAYIKIYRSKAGTTSPLYALPVTNWVFGENVWSTWPNLGIALTIEDNYADADLKTFLEPPVADTGAFIVQQTWNNYKTGYGVNNPVNPHHVITNFGNEQGGLSEPFWGAFSGRHENTSPKGVAGFKFESDYVWGYVGAVGSDSTYDSGTYAQSFFVGTGIGGRTGKLILSGSTIEIYGGSGETLFHEQGEVEILPNGQGNGVNIPWFAISASVTVGAIDGSEHIGVYLDMYGGRHWIDGSSIPVQREVVVTANDYVAMSTSIDIAEAATVAIEGAPFSSDASATIANPMAFWVQSGLSRFDGMVTTAKGSTITIAADKSITPAEDGNLYHLSVSGSDDEVGFIMLGNIKPGTIFTVVADDPQTFKHALSSPPTGTKHIELLGAADYTVGINQGSVFQYDDSGTYFRELSRF